MSLVKQSDITNPGPHHSDRLVTSVALARGQPHKTAEKGKEGGRFLHHLLRYKTEWSKKVHEGGEPYSIPRTYLTQLWHLVCYDLGGK